MSFLFKQQNTYRESRSFCIGVKEVLVVFLILGATFLGQSCVTPADSPLFVADAEVIERSKQQPPNWIESHAKFIGQFKTSDSELYSFVYLKSGMLDLPLGIKQSQLGAMQGSEKAFSEHVEAIVKDLAATSGIVVEQNAQDMSELRQRISQAVRKFHTENSEVKDMYFEKLRFQGQAQSDMPKGHESYRVFVLVTLPKSKMPSLYQDLAGRLTTASQQSLKTLAVSVKNLSQSTQKNVGH